MTPPGKQSRRRHDVKKPVQFSRAGGVSEAAARCRLQIHLLEDFLRASRAEHGQQHEERGADKEHDELRAQVLRVGGVQHVPKEGD